MHTASMHCKDALCSDLTATAEHVRAARCAHVFVYLAVAVVAGARERERVGVWVWSKRGSR